MRELRVVTHNTSELVDITDRIDAEVERAGAEHGVCILFCPHTTAGVTINEAADPDVAADIEDALGQIIPTGVRWRHLEGNSPAHVQASIVGASAQIPICNGRLALGRWQGVFFCEFDGPRERTMWVQVLT